MGSRNYVIDGAMVQCSMGSSPGKIKVTSQQKIFIMGKLKATDQDRILMPTCGSCNISSPPPPCVPQLQPWKNTGRKVTMGTKKFIMNDSFTMCSKGGMIRIMNHAQVPTVSPGKLLAGVMPGLNAATGILKSKDIFD